MVKFSDDKMKEVEAMIARYPQGKQKSALIPLLHLAQEEFGGWLSAETMDYVASLLSIESIEVLGGGVTELQSRITLSSAPNHIVFVVEGMKEIKTLIMK